MISAIVIIALIALIAILIRALNTQKLKVAELLNTIDCQKQGVYRCKLDGSLLSVNTTMVKLYHCLSKADLVTTLNRNKALWYRDPDRRDLLLEELLENDEVKDFVSEYYCPVERKTKWLSETVWLVRDIVGKPLHYVGTLTDITSDYKQRQMQNDMNKLAQNLPGGLFEARVDGEGNLEILYSSSVFAKLLGREHNEAARGRINLLELVHHDHREKFAILTNPGDETQLDIDFQMEDDRGETSWLNITATADRWSDGSLIWYGYLSNISDRKKNETRIHRMAYHDPLTNLPNRRFFTERLAESLSTAAANKHYGAIVYMDLDEFKTLNDSRGHDIGDELLVKVAKRLKSVTRFSDMVSRLGGDEFVALLEEVGETYEDAIQVATHFAKKILSELRREFKLSDGHFATSSSLGVTVFDGSVQSVDTIIREADTAMYQAKRSGRNTYSLFDDTRGELDISSTELDSQLSGAIQKNQLCLYFQPLIGVEGNITGCEALVRWKHPKQGIIAPSVFLPFAEQSGIMNKINDWVLEQACKTLHAWAVDPAKCHMNLSINISEERFASSTILAQLVNLFSHYKFERCKLIIEVTEKLLARRPEAISQQMNAMKQLGIRLSLDDFGTGQSSLTLLNKFPLDQVKIDGGFIGKIETSENICSMIEAILGMAHALDLETVAEHVSAFYQLEFLRQHGCDLFQGYYYYTPMSEDELSTIMYEHSGQPQILPQEASPQLAAI